MQDYTDFPPQKYFLRVLKNCPKSSLIYTQLWKKRGTFMKLMINKKDIRKEYLISPTLFRNLLAPLMFINLVSFIENGEKYEIDILGPNIND